MRSTTKRLTFVVTLCLMIMSLSCASLLLAGPPALENRTLRVSPDIAGFEYQYYVCSKKFIGICVKQIIQKDLYDLTNVAVRNQLISIGFVGVVREKP